MRQIVPQIVLVQKILGQQRMNENVLYRLSTHCMRFDQPEGVLLYQTLTGELLLLSVEEAALLGELPSPASPVIQEIVHRWFLVPEGTDDMAVADQAREIARHLVKKETSLTKYTIFTTTDCNARCFYCFEAGIKRVTMSEQTALDTAHYIAMHCSGKPVSLVWFGGEPLVNARAIDVITRCLCSQGVEFHSNMATNGYLFEEKLVRRAKEDWNLELVQVTMDGAERIYNQRKAYVDPESSPYQQVLHNIQLLLEAGVRVTVRLLMDSENEQDMYALVDELAARFGNRSNFGAYPAVHYENAGINPISYTEIIRSSLAEKLLALQNYSESMGIAHREPLKRELVVSACSADNGEFTAVTPEGLLGRCATAKDCGIWGSIYSDTVDETVLQQWHERTPVEEACKTCAFYPRCIRLKKCPAWPEHCSPILRVNREFRLRNAVMGAYADWKAAGCP